MALRPSLKPVLLGAAVFILAAAALLFPITDWLADAIRWIEAHRTIAWLAYILGYIIATVLLVPGSIVTLAAGFVFGLPAGVAIVSAGSIVGATCAFLVGRFLARDWVAGKIAGMPRFRALDRAAGREGFVIVLLARLSPVFPFNVLNYGLGITSVRLRDYFFASWIGMFPGTVLYVYIGSLAKNLAELTSGELETGAAGGALFVVGLLATIGLTVLITRKATRALGAHLQDSEPEDQG